MRCGESIPVRMRVDAQYCRDACRMAASRARRASESVVPRELRERPRWVRYSTKKVPLRADGLGVASSTDVSTWSTFEQALVSGEGCGMGFVLDGDGVVCIDLDHCLENDQLASWAKPIVEGARGTYIEISPSGSGLHVWGTADMSKGRVVPLAGGGKAEIYPWGRYISVTGVRYGEAPAQLADLSALVAGLVSR